MKLTSTNGTKINVVGELATSISIHTLRRKYCWTFIVAEVECPIIAIDLLRYYKFIINCSKGKLQDPKIDICTTGELTLREGIHLVKINLEYNHEYIKELLIKFLNIIASELGHDFTIFPSDVHHHIDTGDSPPLALKARRLSPEKLKSCRSMLDSLLQSGVLSPSKSSPATPLHFVPRKDPGEWRMVGDYRALNYNTPYHICTIHLSSFMV